MVISTTILGVDKLKKKLNAVQGGRIWEVVKDGGLRVFASAVKNAPVDTGALRNSILPTPLPEDLTMIIHTPIEYAPYQEFGTSLQAGTPFMIPAMNENREIILNNFSKYIKEVLNG